MALSIAKLIKCVASNEERIEIARTALAKDAKFSCIQSFRRLDRSNKGYIDEQGLNDFLKSNGIFPQEKDVHEYCLRKRNPSLRISYDEFVEQLLPQSNFEVKNRCLENDQLQNFFELDSFEAKKVDKSIALLYEREFKFMKELQFYLKDQRLDEFEKVAHRDLYDLEKDQITFQNVRRFMQKNHSDLEESDFNAFQRRIDKNSIGKISLFDFLYFFFPLTNLCHASNRNPFENNNIADPEIKNRQNTRLSDKALNKCNVVQNSHPDMVLLSSCKVYQNKLEIELPSQQLRDLPSVKKLANLATTRSDSSKKVVIEKQFFSPHEDRDKFGYMNCDRHKKIPNLYQSYCDNREYLNNLKRYISNSERRVLHFEEAIRGAARKDEAEQHKHPPLDYTDPEIIYRRYYFEYFDGGMKQV